MAKIFGWLKRLYCARGYKEIEYTRTPTPRPYSQDSSKYCSSSKEEDYHKEWPYAYTGIVKKTLRDKKYNDYV